ncbi:MAG TPA: RNA methyltransferase [Candidatus Limnocylindrales bacterium]|nr:RNA methyltransferase [Candidatus Limnocylindrales bacterium]
MSAASKLDHLSVVLVGTRNPLNIGAAARALSNFGVQGLRVVTPYDPAFREARSAIGASDLLASAREFATVPEAVADCTLVVGTTAVRHRALHQPLRRLEEGARLIRKQLRSARVALLFGSEKFGLSNDSLSHCHWLMRIPTVERNISMNLGQAVAVTLYEIIRDAKAKSSAIKKEDQQLAKAAELERISSLLLETMRASGYLDRRRITDVEERMRRMVRRLRLPARDTEVWLGILRQILWKLCKSLPPQS